MRYTPTREFPFRWTLTIPYLPQTRAPLVSLAKLYKSTFYSTTNKMFKSELKVG